MVINFFSLSFIAVQHERKPILVKKDGNAAAAALAASNEHSENNGAANSTTLFPQGKSFWRSDGNMDASAAGLSNLFPVGFNLVELTTSLAQRGSKSRFNKNNLLAYFNFVFFFLVLPNSYQHSSSDVYGGGGGGGVGGADSQDDDDDADMSAEHNNNMAAPPPLPTMSTEALQMATSKTIIARSLDLVDTLNHHHHHIKADPDRADDENDEEQSHMDNIEDDAAAVAAADDDHDLLNEPLISLADVAFHLQSPSSQVPAYLNAHYVCETGSRLLFLSVYWMKKIPVFRNVLVADTQVLLLRNGWVELFALGLAQCVAVISLPTIVTAMVTQLKASVADQQLEPPQIKRMSEHICRLQEFVTAMVALELDDWEFAYLKIIAVFNVGKLQILCVHKRGFAFSTIFFFGPS